MAKARVSPAEANEGKVLLVGVVSMVSDLIARFSDSSEAAPVALLDATLPGRDRFE